MAATGIKLDEHTRLRINQEKQEDMARWERYQLNR